MGFPSWEGQGVGFPSWEGQGVGFPSWEGQGVGYHDTTNNHSIQSRVNAISEAITAKYDIRGSVALESPETQTDARLRF